MYEFPDVFRENLAIRREIANIEQVEAQTRTMETNLIPHLVFYYGQDAVPGLRPEAADFIRRSQEIGLEMTEMELLMMFDQWQFNRVMMENPQQGVDPSFQLQILNVITEIFSNNTGQQAVELAAPYVTLLNGNGMNVLYAAQLKDAWRPSRRTPFLEGVPIGDIDAARAQAQQAQTAASERVLQNMLGDF
jgi:hypothetical protein